MRRAAWSLVVWLAVPPALRAAEPAVARIAPPDWAADAVWYEVVPDRFRNGDPHNDPRPADLRGSWPLDPLKDWLVSPWTADWYLLQPWEKASGRSFYEAAPLRRYGGDLQGIIDRLDYLQALGVNAICLTPVWEAPSALKYDPTFLHHVDNNFGPDPEGDRLLWATENPADPGTWKWTAADKLFLRLIQECHRRQMKVIVDGVFDHVGFTFWAFRDVRTRGAQSKYAGWFAITRFDDPKTPAVEFEYQGVDGAPDLPELRKEGDSLAAGPREHIHAVVRRWCDPNGDGDPGDGVDGFRVAPERVGRGFGRELRRRVLGINPGGLLAGDLLWQDPAAGKMWNPGPFLRGDQLDTVMNYRLADAAKAFFIDRQGAITATEFDARLATLRAEERPETDLALMNLLDSGRTDRVASQVMNPDRPYDQKRSPADDPKYDVRAPRVEEGKRLRLLAAFQFAYVGAPMVYYGSEAGMWGADAPDNRKPMVWKELRFQDEAAAPPGLTRRADAVRLDDDLLKYYQLLGRARANAPALRRGSVETVLADDARRLFAFVRVEEDRVVAAFNAGGRDLTVDLPFAGPDARDLLSPRRYRSKDGKVSVVIPAFGAVLLAADNR